jgi:hypothetical protein
VEGWLPIFFLMVILKIPVGFLLYIVWWAFRAEAAPEEAPEDGGKDRFRRFRREPRRPRGPRRGPHAPDALPLPAGGSHEGRTRIFTPPAPARAAAAHAAQRGSAEPVE